MKHCSHCLVFVRGSHRKCPLCGNVLSGKNDNGVSGDVFPAVSPSFERHFALRLMIFISIVAIVVSITADFIYPTRLNRPAFVFFGLVSMWICLITILRKRHNITKTIMWHVFIVSCLSVFWDWKVGWRGWSLSYAVPITCVAATVVMYVTAKIMKLSARDYIAYFFLNGLFGIIPVLFILLDLVDVLYPSIISVAVSVIFLSAILIFQGENIKAELNKRMHI